MLRTPRSVLLLVGLLGLSVLSCGREVTGPEDGFPYGRTRMAALALDPQFPRIPGANAASDVEPFERVRVTLLRLDGTVAKDTTLAFASTTDSVRLALDVPLPLTAPDTGITLSLSLRYVNSAGDTVFRGGPTNVTARPASGGGGAPIVLPIRWDPNGALPATLVLTPATGAAVAGTTTTFSAVVTDAGGAPLVGTPVVYSSIDTTRARFAAPGSGVATWLPVRGLTRVVATTLNGIADTSTFDISLPASLLATVSGSAQSAVINSALAQPLVLRVTASDAVPVAGIPVTFAVTTGGGALSATADTSDANGLVSTQWTLGAVIGAQSVTATATGIAGATQVLTATGLAPTPAILTAVSGSAQSGTIGTALAAPFIVRVTDNFANRVAGVTVNWAITAGGGTLGAATSLTDVNGDAAMVLTLPLTAGAVTVQASVTGLAGSPQSFTATAVAGAASALVLTAPPVGGLATATLPAVVVEARDIGGNLVTAFTGTVYGMVATGPGAGLDSTGVAAVAGVATFNAITLSTAAQYTLRFRATGLTEAVSAPFIISAGAATVLAPDGVASGDGSSGLVGQAAPAPLRVVAEDAGGNGVAGVAVTFTGTRGVDTLSVQTIVTDATGLASYSPTLPTTPGLVTYFVTSPGLTGSGFALTVTALAGPATALELTQQPANALSGAVIPTATVRALDPFGNPVGSFTGTVTAAVDSGPALGFALTGTTVVAATAGSASFGALVLDRASQYRLRFTSPGLTAAVSAPFVVAPGAAAQFTAVEGDAQAGGTNLLLASPLGARLADAFGNPIVGAGVTWAVATGGGTLSAPTSTTDAAGIARIGWTLGGAAGVQTVTANAAGLPQLTFTATATLVGGALTWTGAASTLWENAGNWLPARLPNAADSVYFPAGLPMPTTTGLQAVRALVNDNANPVTFAGGAIVSERLVLRADSDGLLCNGATLTLTGATTSSVIAARGRVRCNVSVTQGVVLLGDSLVVADSSFSIGGSARVVPARHTLRVARQLVTTATGSLEMTDAADTVIARDATFGGAGTTGLLREGALILSGSLLTTAGGDAFRATDNHRTVFTAGVVDTANISFLDPANSGFSRITVQRPVRVQTAARSVVGLVSHGGAITGPGRFIVEGDFTGTSGTLVNVRAFELGGLLADTGTFRPDTTVLTGAAQLLRFRVGAAATPQYQAVRITGSVNIGHTGGIDSIAGPLIIEGSATLSDPGFAADLRIAGDLVVQGTGRFRSQVQPHLITVWGNARFAGATSDDDLATGTLRVAHDLTQLSTTSARSFRPSVGFATYLDSVGTVSFADAVESRFGALYFTTSGVERTLASEVRVAGRLHLLADGGLTLRSSVVGTDAGTRLLAVNGLEEGGGATFRNVALRLEGTEAVSTSSTMRFDDFGTSAVQFEIARASGTIFLYDPIFATVPTGAGRYLRVVDTNVGDASALTVNVDGTPTPFLHGGLAEAVAPAVLNGWSASVPAITWTGAASSSWTNGLNWSGGSAPTATDSAHIAAGTPNEPSIISTVTVRALSVAAGATVTLTANLTINGSVAVEAGGLIDAVDGQVILTGAGAHTLRGNIGSFRIANGSYSVAANSTITGGVEIYDGDLSIGPRTLTITEGLFVGAGGTLTMTDPAGVFDIGTYANFFGNSTAGRLTNGVLRVRGDFDQLDSGIPGPETQSFAPSGAHVTELAGPAVQRIRFDSPDTTLTAACTTSCFANLRSTKTDGGINFANGVKMLGSLDLGGADSINAVGAQLVVGGSARLDAPIVRARLVAWRDTLRSNGALIDVDSTVAWGTGTPLVGFPSVRTVVQGSHRLTGFIEGTVHVTGSLDIDGPAATVEGNLRTLGAGTVRMTDATDTLSVIGDAIFSGGATDGLLTAGALMVYSDLIQSVNPGAFSASGTHRTVFAGADQGVDLANPGAGSSSAHFQHLELRQDPGSSLILQNSIFVNGQLFEDRAPGVRMVGALAAGPYVQLVTRGASVSGLRLDRVQWLLNDGATVGTLQGLTIDSLPTSLAQFIIARSGGSVLVDGITFVIPPTTGHYLRADDTVADASDLIVTVVNPAPAAHGGRVLTSGGAQIVGWGTLPTIRWTGTTSTNWGTASNWNLGRVPTATDSVVIDLTGAYTVDLTSSATVGHLTLGSAGSPTLVIGSGGTLTLDSSAVLGATSTLRVSSGGTLAGEGDAIILGTLDWNGGTMQGNGTTLVVTGATANVATTTGVTIDDRTFAISGTANIGGAGVAVANDPGIAVVSGGTLNFVATASFFPGASAIDILNAGTVRKASTAGNVRLEWPMINSGTVVVEDDTLDMRNEFQHVGGTVEVQAGATLAHRGESAFNAAVSVADGGTLLLTAGGTVPDAGNHVFGPTSVLSGLGLVQLNSADTVRFQGGMNIDSLSVQNGLTWFEAADTMFVRTGAFLGGGAIRGDGVLAITGAFEQFPGNLNGTGTFAVRPTGTFTLRGALRGWNVDVAGTLRWVDTDLSFEADPVSLQEPTITIRSGGVWDLLHGTTTPRELFASSGSNVSVLAGGVIRKSSGTGTSNFRPAITLAGSFDVLTGTINVQGACTVTGGTKTGPGALTGNCVVP